MIVQQDSVNILKIPKFSRWFYFRETSVPLRNGGMAKSLDTIYCCTRSILQSRFFYFQLLFANKIPAKISEFTVFCSLRYRYLTLFPYVIEWHVSDRCSKRNNDLSIVLFDQSELHGQTTSIEKTRYHHCKVPVCVQEDVPK